MYDDFIIPCTLLLVLAFLVGLLFSIVHSLNTQRNWSSRWRDLAARTGLAYKDTTNGPGLSGMYNGRIVSLLGTPRSGVNVLLSTNNRTNNQVKLKPRQVPGKSRYPLERLFSVECRSSEFKSLLLSSTPLAESIAPLARAPRASLTLSGQELSYKTHVGALSVQELIDTLDMLCDFSTAIEEMQTAS